MMSTIITAIKSEIEADTDKAAKYLAEADIEAEVKGMES